MSAMTPATLAARDTSMSLTLPIASIIPLTLSHAFASRPLFSSRIASHRSSTALAAATYF